MEKTRETWSLLKTNQLKTKYKTMHEERYQKKNKLFKMFIKILL